MSILNDLMNWVGAAKPMRIMKDAAAEIIRLQAEVVRLQAECDAWHNDAVGA